jgi:hypothetical protein
MGCYWRACIYLLLIKLQYNNPRNKKGTGRRFHERTMNFVEVSGPNPSFKPLLLGGGGGGGIKTVIRGKWEKQGGKLLKLLYPITSKNSASGHGKEKSINDFFVEFFTYFPGTPHRHNPHTPGNSQILLCSNLGKAVSEAV